MDIAMGYRQILERSNLCIGLYIYMAGINE